MKLNSALLSRSLLIPAMFAGMLLAPTMSIAQEEPPLDAHIARIQGNVSIQPAGVDDWGQAEPNMPLNDGDRLFTDQQSRAEFQAGPVRGYFFPNSDVTVKASGPGVEIGLAQGSTHFFSDGFPYGGGLQIQTPNGAVTIAAKASFRVDVNRDDDTTIITNSEIGSLALNGGGGFGMFLGPGQSVALSGSNPVYAQPLAPAAWDEFSNWAIGFENSRMNSISFRYVNPAMPGYGELDAAGDWQGESQYGPIWFPRVQAGWAPYHYGHWVHHLFFGWTWVPDEPWGAAPFHYGRWVVLNGRWGWIPGPREGNPIWSPAQVVFAGGVSFGGGGVSVWFPLGPGEPFKPWYPASPQYINQINITNIHESTVIHVQTNYVNIVNNTTNVTNITYVNRTVGVTAMKQSDFASGRPAQSAAVKVDPQQLAHIQPAKPEAAPPAKPVILHPIVKPAAVAAARPVLVNNKGQMTQAVPNAKPVPIPVKANPTPPKPIPGRTAVGTATVGNKPAPPPAKPAVEAAKPEAKPMVEPAAKPAAPPAKTTAPPPASKPVPAPAAKPVPPPAAKPEAKPVPPPAEAKPAPVKPAETKPAPDAKDKNKKKPADKKDEKPKEDAPK